MTDLFTQICGLRQRLIHYALKLTRNLNDAEELAQATIVKALQSTSKYQEGEKLFEWLGTMLYHMFYDQKRKETRYKHQPLENYDRIVEPSQFNAYFLKEISALVNFPLEPTDDIFSRKELKDRFVGREKLRKFLDE